MQTLFVRRHCKVTLLKDIEGDLSYVEAPRLLHDFYVGGMAMVGSIFPRTFGNDYWQTSNVLEITKVEFSFNEAGECAVRFRTRNSNYVLIIDPANLDYRDDLEDLVVATQNLYTTDPEAWLKEAIAFKARVDAEYKVHVNDLRND